MSYRGRHLKLRRSQRWPWLVLPVLALSLSARPNTNEFPAVEASSSGQFTAVNVAADVVHERPRRPQPTAVTSTTSTTRLPVRKVLPEPVRKLTPPKPKPAVNTSRAARVLAAARAMLGVPYVYGGNSLSGMDCSAFTQRAYAAVGIGLPRYSGDQHLRGVQVREPQPGDLVWWGPSIAHVAIYYGHGQIIGAHRPGVPSSISPLWGSPRFYRMF